jgi:hypothetical protein
VGFQYSGKRSLALRQRIEAGMERICRPNHQATLAA